MDTMTEIERRPMPGALYVKRPAEVVRQETATTELLTAGRYERRELRVAAQRMERRGEIRIVRREVWNEAADRWTMVVRRVKPAPPVWRRPALIAGGITGAIVLLIGLGWWALTALTTASVVSALLTVLAMFVGGVWLSRRGGQGGNRGVDVQVRVRVR